MLFKFKTLLNQIFCAKESVEDYISTLLYSLKHFDENIYIIFENSLVTDEIFNKINCLIHLDNQLMAITSQRLYSRILIHT